jgi:hypothetical protein
MDDERRPDVRSIGIGNIFFGFLIFFLLSFRHTLTQSFAQMKASIHVYKHKLYNILAACFVDGSLEPSKKERQNKKLILVDNKS